MLARRTLVPMGAFLAVLFSNFGCKSRSFSQLQDVHVEGSARDGFALFSPHTRVDLSSGQTLHLFEMVHIAERRYYEDLQNAFAEILRQDPQAVLLREGIHCEGSLLWVSHQKSFRAQWFQNNDSSVVGPSSIPESTLEEMSHGKKPFLEELPCELSKPPGNFDFDKQLDLSEESTVEEDILKQQDVPSLYASFPDSQRVLADLNLTLLSRSQQVAYSLFSATLDAVHEKKNVLSLFSVALQRDLHFWLEVGNGRQFVERTYQEVVLAERTKALWRAVKRQIEKGTRTMVVPWGKDHLDAISFALREEFGASATRVADYRVATCLHAKDIHLEANTYTLTRLGAALCSEAVRQSLSLEKGN